MQALFNNSCLRDAGKTLFKLQSSTRYLYLSESISPRIPEIPILTFVVSLYVIQHLQIKSPDCDVLSRKPGFQFPR